MIFRSPYPDVAISELSLTPFVLQHAETLASKPALIDASSDRVLTYGELAQEVKTRRLRTAPPGDAQRGCLRHLLAQ